MPSNALWRREFTETIADIGDACSVSSYNQSAERLLKVLDTGLLAVDDIRNDPEKFFEAHRMVAKHVHRLGPEFWIRFTVQYNLFAGTIMALASSQQVEEFVQRNGNHPKIGCFALTEERASEPNQSGLILDTTAELATNGLSFLIQTPNSKAAKSWVSQGLVADEVVVVATMIVHGHSYGPQAFLIKLRDLSGAWMPGIMIEDMGQNEIGSELDNARIVFDRVRVPLSAHLCRYLEVRSDGTVHHPYGFKLRTMDIIGQRLFTGRVTVAQAALAFARSLFEKSSDMNFVGNKRCWAPITTKRQSRLSACVVP